MIWNKYLLKSCFERCLDYFRILILSEFKLIDLYSKIKLYLAYTFHFKILVESERVFFFGSGQNIDFGSYSVFEQFLGEYGLLTEY